MAKTKKIKTNIIDDSFSNNPHDYYIVYDDMTDEFIILLVEPDTMTVVHDIKDNENIGLIIDPDSNEIVGFNLYNFTSAHLPKWTPLNRYWYKRDIQKQIENYLLVEYDPKEHKQHHHKEKNISENFPPIVAKTLPILEEALA